MRKVYLTLLLLTATNLLYAAPVGLSQAQQQASKFVNNAVASKMMRKAPGKSLTLVYSASRGKDKTLYVFNRQSNSGYVIISGDDRTVPVLGYSDRGSFSLTDAPDNLRAWLKGYERQIGYLLSHPQLQNSARLYGTGNAVEPLLGNIAWDQGDPYNKKCPSGCPTGCVATAMGQVMYYNRWPEKGVGSHSYLSKDLGQTLSADFGNTTYRWDDMTPTLTTASSSAAIDAVSTLLYQVGVSVDMQYSSQGSGALPSLMAPALVKYFNYDKACTLLMRDYYTTDEWEQILRSELDARRAVLYGGFTANNEGHSFVCDGYDAKGYFHINWGWSGDSNGYFLLAALDPDNQGTGGAASGGGFEYSQNMIVGIQKPVEGSKPVPMLTYVAVADTAFTVSKTDSVPLVATEVYNDGSFDVLAHLRFNVYDKDSNLVAFSSVVTDSMHAGYGFDSIVTKFAVPASLSDGKYKAVLAGNVADIDENGVYKDMRHYMGENYYYVIDVKDGKATYATAGQSHLTVKGIDINPNPIESDKPLTVTAAIHNDGGEFNGRMCYSLTYPTEDDDPYATTYSDIILCNIKENSDGDIVFHDTLTLVGNENYKLQLWRIDGDHYYRVGKSVDVSVNGNALPPRLECTKFCEFASGNETVTKDSMDFVSYIKNKGGEFKGKLTCLIFQDDNAYKGEQLCSLDTVDVDLKQSESVELHIPGKFENAETGSTYFAVLYNVTDDDWMIPAEMTGCYFTVVDDPSKLEPMLYLKEKISIDITDLKNAIVKAVVFNAGGEYNGKMRIDIYPRKAYSPVKSIGEREVNLKTGQKDTLTFAGDLLDLETGKEYFAEIVYYDSDHNAWAYYDSWKSYYNYPLYADAAFTIPESTGISRVATAEVYDVVDAFTLTGQRVARFEDISMDDAKTKLAPGYYILRGSRGKTSRTLRIIK